MRKFHEFISEDLFNQSNVDRELLFSKIQPLGKWLVTVDGLGMMTIIDEIFDEYGYKNQLTSQEIDEFGRGLEILKKTDMDPNYINRKLRDKISGGIENLKLVRDEDGNWDFLNKLNTNYSALADLLTELIIRGLDVNYEKGIVIYNNVISDSKEGLMGIKRYIKRLIIHYFIDKGDGLNDFRKFTVKIKEMSEIGEKAEDRVCEYLESKGFEVCYRGGNGDFIDMIFGCDMIVHKDDIGYKTVQVKNRFPGWESVSYYKIDWLGILYPKLELYELTKRSNVIL